MDEWREFLRDLFRPFGMRHLRRFLRGNWWILLILLAAAGYGILQSPLGSIITGRVWDGPPDPKFTFLDGSGFDLETCNGLPDHAIDPAGDLIPIFERDSRKLPVTVTIWSLSQKKAVLRAQWTRASIYTHREKVFRNPKTGEFIVGINMPMGADLSQLDDAMILVIDPATQTIKKRFSIPRLTQLCDVSIDGLSIVGMQIPPIDFGRDLDLSPVIMYTPVIVSMDTGKFFPQPIRFQDCRFGGSDTLIGICPNGIASFNFASKQSDNRTAIALRTLFKNASGGRILKFFDVGDINTVYAVTECYMTQGQYTFKHPILKISLRPTLKLINQFFPEEFSETERRLGGELEYDLNWNEADYDPRGGRMVIPTTYMPDSSPIFGGLMLDFRTKSMVFRQMLAPKGHAPNTRFVGSDLVYMGYDYGGEYIRTEDFMKGRI